MNSYPSLNPMATVCIREAAEEVRDVHSLRALGLVLDKMELRHAGSVTGDIPLYDIRKLIKNRIAAIDGSSSSGEA
jgi:hypothetical protein